MVYVCGRLLDEMKEVHRESEAVICQTVQAGGRHANLLFKVMSQGSSFIATKFTNPAEPVDEVIDTVNYAFQSVLEAHNFDPRECVIVEEFGCRSDQPIGVCASGRARLNMHGPITTCVPQCTPNLALQEFLDVGYISVHHKVRQITRVWLQPLQQPQTSKRNIRVMNRRCNKEPRVGGTVGVL